MPNEGTRTRLIRYAPHAIIATLAVTALPLLVVSSLQSVGLLRTALGAIFVGALVSLLISAAGTMLWARFRGAGDLVFGDLMVWGWLRRARVERRLLRAAQSLGPGGNGWGEGVSPSRQAELLRSISADLEARHAYTHGHTSRVTRHAYMIANAMGLSPDEVEMVRVAASVHDVGKVFIPLEVLDKPGRLTDEEFALVKHHSERGAELVSGVGSSEITAMIRSHHERLDGSGYPDGLAGEEIPLGARIIAVADTFDAITSTRSYQDARPHKEAIRIIDKEAGISLDGRVVEAFRSYYSGRRTLEWRVAVTTLPQRILTWLGTWFRNVATPAMAQGAATVGAAVLVGGSFAAPSVLPVRAADAEETAPAVVTGYDIETVDPSPDKALLATADHSKASSRRGGHGQDRKRNRDASGDDSTGDDKPGDADSTRDADSTSPDSGGGDSGGGGSGGGSGSGKKVTDRIDDTVGGATDTVNDTVDSVTDVVDGVVDEVVGKLPGL